MAIPSVEYAFHSCSSAVIVLLLLSATASGQSLKLKNSFEEALVNDSVNLWRLQQVYFNPSQFSSPMKVCLTVVVTIPDIIDPNDMTCGYSIEHPSPAFKSCNDSDMWVLTALKVYGI